MSRANRTAGQESIQDTARQYGTDEFVHVPTVITRSSRLTLDELLISLNPSFSVHQLIVYKLALSTLGIAFSLSQDKKNFSEVYRLLEQKLPKQAVSITMEIMNRLSLPGDMLSSFVDQPFTIDRSVPDTDLLLALGSIIIYTTDSVYNNFIDLVQRRLLRSYHIDNLRHRGVLVQTLFDRNLIVQENLGHFFSFISVSGGAKYLKVLKEFCVRQGIQVPRVSNDFPINDQRGVGQGHASDQSHSQGTSALAIPFVSPPTNDELTSAKEQTDPWDTLSQQPTEENGGETSRVVNGELVERDNGVRTTNREIAGYSPGLEPTPLESHYGTIIYKESPIPVRKPRWCQSCIKSKLCHCSCCSFTTLLLAVLLFSVWVWYNYSHHLLLADPPQQTGHVGSNTTNLLGCYNPQFTQSVTINTTTGTTTDPLAVSDIFVTKHSQLNITTLTLPPSEVTFTRFSDSSIGVNYYGNDKPVYVANEGILRHHVTNFTYDGPSSLCPARFYSFSSQKDYDDFVSSTSDHTSPPHHLQSSECIVPRPPDITSTPDDEYSFDFTFNKEGFYFVGAFLEENVHFNLIIEGYLTYYDTSNERHCSLDSVHRTCKVDVSRWSERVCVLSRSTKEQYRLLKISVDNIDWNTTNISLTSVGLFMLLIAVVFTIVCCCCVYYCKVLKPKRKYTQMLL